MSSFLDFRRRANAAFTIIELLVAVAVTAVLVTFMVTVTSNVLSAWNRSSGILSAGNQARTIMDQISQDLEGAIIRRGSDVMFTATLQRSAPSDGPVGRQWFASKPDRVVRLVGDLPSEQVNGRPSTANAELTELRFGQAGVWLRFFTTPSDNTPDSTTGEVPLTNISAPRAVGYQLARVDMGGGQFSYLLYRSEVDPQAVFTEGYNLVGGNYIAANGILRSPGRQWIIGNDVIDFGVRLYSRNASGGLDVIFPTSSTGHEFQSSNTAGYPAVAEVFLRILSPEGVRQIAALEGNRLTRPPEYGTDAEYWWAIAEQNSQIYTRRIEIKSKGL